MESKASILLTKEDLINEFGSTKKSLSKFTADLNQMDVFFLVLQLITNFIFLWLLFK
jgi:hypothetical protein